MSASSPMVSTAFRNCQDCRSWSGGSDGKCTHPDAPHHDAGPLAAKWCGFYIFRAPMQTLPPDRVAPLVSARAMLAALLPDLGAIADLAKSADRGDLSEAIEESRSGLCGVLGLLEAATMPPMPDPRHGGV